MNEAKRQSSLNLETVKYDTNNATDIGNDRFEQQPQPLPLEWTRIQRRNKNSNDIGGDRNIASDKKRSRSSELDETEEIVDEECIDVNCRRCIPRDLLLLNLPHTTTTMFEATTVSDVNMRRTSTDGITNRQLSGKIIFCLPDQDCEWFQGYFFPFENEEIDFLQLPSRNAPFYYGVLCTVKQDIDECLQCNAGGYREISNIQMTILNDRRSINEIGNDGDQSFQQQHSQHTATNVSSTVDTTTTVTTTTTTSTGQVSYPKHINISNVTWVGGDMMSLYKIVTRPTPNITTTSTPIPSKLPTSTNTEWNDITPTMSVLRMQTSTLYTGSERVSSYVQRYFSTMLQYMLDSYNSTPSQKNGPDDDGTNDGAPIVPQISLIDDKSYKQVIDLVMPDVAIIVGTMNLLVT